MTARTCSCGAHLSRYNDTDTCGPCQRTALLAALQAAVETAPTPRTTKARIRRHGRILRLLKNGPMSAKGIAHELGSPRATIDQDLCAMAADELVEPCGRIDRTQLWGVPETDYDELMGAA